MASENKEAPARDDTILISPDGDGPATELLREAETMQAPDEAWPVAEFYRVEPDEDLASASQGTASRSSRPGRRPRLRQHSVSRRLVPPPCS